MAEDQSPRGGLRQVQRRSQVFEDVTPFTLSDDYEGANLVTSRASATWGPPIDVRGRDEVTVLVTFTKVAGMTGLVIAFQDGSSDSKQDPEWYDRHATFDAEQGGNVVVPTTPVDLTLDVSGFSAAVHRIAVSLQVRAPFMRFKPYAAGTVAGTRCTLKGIRNLRSE